MATIDELLGPAQRIASISDLLGPEQPRKFFNSPQPAPEPSIPTADEFLDLRTFVKTPKGEFKASQTEQERVKDEMDTVGDELTNERIAAQLNASRFQARGGLEKTLAGLIRFTPKWIPSIRTFIPDSWVSELEARGEKDIKTAEELGGEIGGGKAGKTVREFSSTAIQSLPALAAAPAGIGAMAIAAGVQSGGSVTEEAFETYREKGDPDALNKSRIAGLLAGSITAGLTRIIPGGTERLVQGLLKGEISRKAGQGIVGTILKEVIQEFPEEALDQASQGVIAKLSYRPETSWSDIADDSIKAGLTGSVLAGLLGGAAGGVQTTRRGISRLRRTAPTDVGQEFGEPIIRTQEDQNETQQGLLPVEVQPEAVETTPQTQEVAPKVISGVAAPEAIAGEVIPPSVVTPVSKKPIPSEWRVSVQPEEITPDGDVMPGNVQIVDPSVKTERSKSPTVESLIADGYDVPDFTKLPKGTYTVEQAKDLMEAGQLKTESVDKQSTIQKFRIGRSPQTFTIVEELPATPIEIENNEQAVRVKNERTGEVQDVLKSQLVPVQSGTGVKAEKRDLDAELASRKLDPSVFPNAKSKRAAIDRHDAMGSNRQLAESIAGKLEGLKSGVRPGDVQAFGIIPAVWDAAISIAQSVIRAGGTVADAVQKAIDHIRANNGNPFDESGAGEFLKRSVEPQPEFQEPIDESDPESEGGLTVNIAGRPYDVVDKMKLTPEQREAGDTSAQATFKSLGIPGAPDTTVDKRAGSIDNNTVYRVIPDGSFHDEAGNALREHLIEQIQIQNSPEGDPAYVSSLINAINMNFDFGNWRNVISQPVLESLLNVSVGESSRRGTMLRQIRGISQDIRAVAQNAELRLKWVYAQAFDPDGVASEVIRKVRESIGNEETTPIEREEKLREVLKSLTPEKRAKVQGTPLGKKIEKIIKAGGLDDFDLFKAFAKEHRWTIPKDSEIEQMRQWAAQEQSLTQPTDKEIARHGGIEAARSAVESATLDTRKELLRKMNTQWSRWTQPLVTNWRDLLNAEKVKNSNTAFNEWVAANLLLKIGFGTRQIVDVFIQTIANTPTRALSYAWNQWDADKSANRDLNLQRNLAEVFRDAYRTRFKVLGYALNSFKQTMKGKGEQRQVEQLISTIGIFDRMLMKASEMRLEGKNGAASLLEFLAVTTRMGRQFAAALDVLHGIPAEAQEIAHKVRAGLREKGLGEQAVNIQFDEIIGILQTHRLEALSWAKEIVEIRGGDSSNAAIERAAWHILREKIYNAAKQAELTSDEWKKQNSFYRDQLGWNLPETKGIKGIGGPGGLVALGGKAAKEMLSNVPIVGGVLSIPFTFSNAIGISMNRKLAWSPLQFVPWYNGSPYWQGKENLKQRKIEAIIGTPIHAVLLTLIISGVWKALPAFWPKDEKERDKWVKNGWSPGMVIIPWGDNQEVHLSTRTGPLAFFAPTIAAAAAYQGKQESRAKKQAEINERAAKLGIQPEQLPEMSIADWMGVMAGAGWSSLSGGRTASGVLAAYTDYGNFNVKKAGASLATATLPGVPALNEFGRLAGGNINPKFASFWDLMVPMPTSEAQRVNMLGDPMRDENDYRRIFTILSGGNFPFPTQTTPAETQAYATLFNSEYRPPSINPARGYQIRGKLRPFNSEELQQYTVARGQEFKRELGGLSPYATEAEVKTAYQRANERALQSVGAMIPVRPRRTRTRRSRLRGNRTRLRTRSRRSRFRVKRTKRRKYSLR